MKKDKKNKYFGWYPVSIEGWIITYVYTLCVAYIVYKTNMDELSLEDTFLKASLFFMLVVIMSMLFSLITGQRPYEKK